MNEKLQNFIDTYWNTLCFIALVLFLLCCYSIWCRFREDATSTSIKDSSIAEQITEAQSNQSAISEGLAESAGEAESIGREMQQLRKEATDAEGRIREAGEIIAECESIISDILKGNEKTNH